MANKFKDNKKTAAQDKALNQEGQNMGADEISANDAATNAKKADTDEEAENKAENAEENIDGRAEGEAADKADGAEGDSSDKDEYEADGKTSKASIDKKDAQIAELKDRLMRQMAEFDNYRKRTDKEKAQNYDIGASDFILKLLPVVDNFERGLGSMSEQDRTSSFGQGIEMIYKQLRKVLEDEKVVEIDAIGKEFDPAFHNAVMQQPSDEYESGTVMQVLLKGYMYKDRVLRHSMVMVAQ